MDNIITTTIRLKEKNYQVRFLGNNYMLPSDILDYIKYIHIFEKYKNDDYQLLLQQMNKKTFAGGSDEDFAVWSRPLVKQGQEIIDMLLEMGIYDITIEDLVIQNVGYIKLREVCTETLDGMRIILADAIGSYIKEMDANKAKAASTITGPGFGIITNSFTSLLAYGLMESMTLSSQAKKADEMYRQSMKQVNARNSSVREQKETALLTGTYYPGVKKCLDMFTAEMMSVFMVALKDHGLIDLDSVSKYNIERSNQLTKNASGKSKEIARGALSEAFKSCPFNSHIYLEAYNCNVIDLDTCNTALFLGLEEDLIPVFIEKCRLEESIYKADQTIEYIAVLEKKSKRDVIRHHFSNYYEEKNRKYNLLYIAAQDHGKLTDWRITYISPDPDKFVSMTEEEIIEKVNLYLDSICSDTEESYLISMDLLSTEYFPDNKYCGREYLNEYLASMIIEKLLCSRQEIADQIKEKERLCQLIEAEKKEAEEKKAAEKLEKRKRFKNRIRRIVTIAIPIFLCIGIVVILINNIINPFLKYKKAEELLHNKQYDAAIEAFTALGNYRDSSERIVECENDKYYQMGLECLQKEQGEDALIWFAEVDENYKDVQELLKEATTLANYNIAIGKWKNYRFQEAYNAFKSIMDYKDSSQYVEEYEKYRDNFSNLESAYKLSWKSLLKGYEKLQDIDKDFSPANSLREILAQYVSIGNRFDGEYIMKMETDSKTWTLGVSIGLFDSSPICNLNLLYTVETTYWGETDLLGEPYYISFSDDHLFASRSFFDDDSNRVECELCIFKDNTGTLKYSLDGDTITASLAKKE